MGGQGAIAYVTLIRMTGPTRSTSIVHPSMIIGATHCAPEKRVSHGFTVLHVCPASRMDRCPNGRLAMCESVNHLKRRSACHRHTHAAVSAPDYCTPEPVRDCCCLQKGHDRVVIHVTAMATIATGLLGRLFLRNEVDYARIFIIVKVS